MKVRATSPLAPNPDWRPTPGKGPWREVGSGRWEHDAHGATVQAVGIVDDGGAEYTGWEVWTDKPHDTFRELLDAKRAASHLGRYFPRSRSSSEAAQTIVTLADARRVADERLHTLIVDDDFNDNDSLPFSDVACAVFTVHVQQAVDDYDPAPVRTPARSSIPCSSTLQPASRCSSFASSISLWLMPSLHGTKIMPAGARRAT